MAAGAAQAKTASTMTWVVPYSAGSAQDILARLVGEHSGQALGTRVIVLNKPGAGGTLGAAFVAASKPDGNTLLVAAANHHLAGALHAQLSYHPLHSFRGAAFVGHSDYVLLASETMQVSDLSTFVQKVRAQPQHFNFASSGNGSITHVAMAAFLARAGLHMSHIPMKGSGEMLQELLAGRVHAAMFSPVSLQALKASNRLQPLAITSLQRSPLWPQLPTVAESGYAGFQWTSWGGLLAPKDTPEAAIQNIHEALTRVLAESSLQQRLQALGFVCSQLTHAQFDKVRQNDWADSLGLIQQLRLDPV